MQPAQTWDAAPGWYGSGLWLFRLAVSLFDDRTEGFTGDAYSNVVVLVFVDVDGS